MAVPQRTLNWLHSVLFKVGLSSQLFFPILIHQNPYNPQQSDHDRHRTYHDVTLALSQCPSLSPRTDVYTYETGYSALLLHLVGTLPVTFRGTTYRFPIALWIPNAYPREPPIVYVTPTPEMTVRVGQHVTLEGQVYHHYLAHWAEAWERSTIATLLSILQDVFAKEPPVRYRQQMPQPQPGAAATPPPLPPLPPGVGLSTQQAHRPPPTSQSEVPPPPPPKPGVAGEHQQQQQQPPHQPAQYRSPPPLPPLPPKEQDLRRTSLSTQATTPGLRSYEKYTPTGHNGALISSPRPLTQPLPHQSAQGRAPYYGGTVPYQTVSNVSNQFPPQAGSTGARQPPHQSHHPQPSGPPYPQNSPYPPNYPRPPPMDHVKADTPDLLTSPFDVELPTIAPTGPAPPIPPNPEKDALLRAVSQTLAETLRVNAAQSDAAAQSLVSQSRSLHTAMATLQGEMSALNALNATLQSNTTVLQQSIHRADAAIADAQARATSVPSTNIASTSAAPGDAPAGLPPIDEVLVAPTVVGKQLYDLVAEERGIQQALYALQAALVRGVIGVDSWSRHTRSLAREALLKRALIRKIGRGMGLEESVA
ncbi:uncharacterized protein N7515_004298 [Penicillium bovifimosum]|uniref:Endosomal sorting complex protein TSG101 n=1 Tax=Penicillium bovifimosum TaxID=126998 RepID=A0A9W9H074_9EURO|nr:uncharacterized protein N7515_004298 [Penicillium bovifimosum]KAJ5135020.1 hypothetical protein N7515_004298 [Penicillium bovifimosum]